MRSFQTLAILFAILVGVVTLTLLLLAGAWWERRRARWKRRLNGVGPEEPETLPSLVPEAPKSWSDRLDQGFDNMIQRTGLEVDSSQALGFMTLVGVALGGALFVWRGEPWLAVLGLVVGSGGVLLYYWIRRNRYHRQLQDQLPDTFYLMARSLRTGMSLEQVIALVGDQGTRPLAGEFKRCAGQLELGLSVAAGLQLMAKRLRLLDFDAFVSTVMLYQTTGGNLPQLLDRLAAGARDRNQFRNYFLSATAYGRVMAIALALAAPLLLLAYAIFQPDFSRPFFQSVTGWTTVAVVACLELIGALWLFSLLKIEY
jgi:tight adherence protein B